MPTPIDYDPPSFDRPQTAHRPIRARMRLTRKGLFFLLESVIFIAAASFALFVVHSDFAWKFSHTENPVQVLAEASCMWLSLVAMILFLVNGFGCMVGMAVMAFYHMITGD